MDLSKSYSCFINTVGNIQQKFGPEAHPASCKMGIGSFPGVKCGRGVLLTTHPLLVRGHGRVELYLYRPSGPHRACNGITLPLPIKIISFDNSNLSSLASKSKRLQTR